MLYYSYRIEGNMKRKKRRLKKGPIIILIILLLGLTFGLIKLFDKEKPEKGTLIYLAFAHK